MTFSRVSTAGFYAQGMLGMQAQQSKLATLQQQLATGSKLIKASDNPVGAGTAVGLDRAAAELERFDANAEVLRRRLGMQENVLADAGAQIGRARDLMLQGNNAALSTEDRTAISAELVQIRENLLALANSQDGAGRYLFGGTQDAVAPFSSGAGGVTYHGDQTQRRIDVGPALAVADAAPGSEAFMRVRTGDGRMDAAAAPGNAGTGLLMDFGMSTGGSWSGPAMRVTFVTADRYAIETQAADGSWTPLPDSEADYVPGATIALGDGRLTIEGAPAAGDSFQAGPAATRDIFATLDAAIAALATDAVTPEEKAARTNAISAALRDVSTATEHLIDLRAKGGAQLSALDGAADLNEAQGITIAATLSGLRDLDYAEAMSRLSLSMMGLEAAQAAFLKTQSMSLFQRLG